MPTKPIRIDALQYCAWSRPIFEEMRAGGVDAVHATLSYHGTFRQAVADLTQWHRRFQDHDDLITPARSSADIRQARATGRTAILLGSQTPQILDDDIGLLQVWHDLGLRVMQLTYNTQSALGTGWTEAEDTGLTRMGHEVVEEMNRLGLLIDLSHAGQRTARAAIDASARPVAITHANPHAWHPAGRNIPDETLAALFARGGMLGFSLYPHHLAGGSDCTLEHFCQMVADLAARYGTAQIGIGSDLCQGQPDSVVTWMRNGRWTRSRDQAQFPAQPSWFQSNRDFDLIDEGLAQVGFDPSERAGILGENWLGFWDTALEPAP